MNWIIIIEFEINQTVGGIEDDTLHIPAGHVPVEDSLLECCIHLLLFVYRQFQLVFRDYPPLAFAVAMLCDDHTEYQGSTVANGYVAVYQSQVRSLAGIVFCGYPCAVVVDDGCYVLRCLWFHLMQVSAKLNQDAFLPQFVFEHTPPFMAVEIFNEVCTHGFH